MGGSKVINYVESIFGEVIIFIRKNGFEGGDGVFEVDEFIFDISENLGDSERLV